jgi:hypothetical protein
LLSIADALAVAPDAKRDRGQEPIARRSYLLSTPERFGEHFLGARRGVGDSG